MFCLKCGKEVPNDASYCPHCGAYIKKADDSDGSTDDVPVEKSALAAGLFGIFLGSFGVHNFYLGYTSKAVVQVVLTCCIVFWPISFVWGLVEGIMILTGDIRYDGNGNLIKKDF
ncbi:MAG: TM2 domain-containing protein [Bacilli bacterium]